MGKMQVENRSTEPKNFFAGDFPTVPESATAAEAVAEFAPVAKNENGELINITADTVANVTGITAEAAEAGEPAVYYMTGEFHADALNLPDGVTVDAIKDSLRKLSIFLK